MGFTLVEVLLAVSLALGLMLSMLWFYQHAADIRTDVTEQIERVATHRRVMDRLTDQLRSAINYPVLNIGLDGINTELTFVSAVLPDQTAWAVLQVTEDPIPPQQDVRLVALRLRVGETENGEQVIEGIEVGVQRVIAMSTVEEGEGVEWTLLSPHFKFLRFRYWDGQQFVETWNEQGLPRAVEVGLGIDPLPEGVEPIDYPNDLATRVVYLSGTQSGATVRGGGLRGLGGGLP